MEVGLPSLTTTLRSECALTNAQTYFTPPEFLPEDCLLICQVQLEKIVRTSDQHDTVHGGIPNLKPSTTSGLPVTGLQSQSRTPAERKSKNLKIVSNLKNYKKSLE
jgi:hypothetical protein